MYRFEHYTAFYLFLLLLLVVAMYLFYVNYQKKKFRFLADSQLLQSILRERSKSKKLLKFILAIVSFALIIVSIANLQIGGKLQKQLKSETIDLMLVIDVSHSMLAEDIKPNRMERAKMYGLRLVDNVKFAKIGIVVFAGDAYVHMPVTSDRGAVKMFINSITTDLISTQGTNIGQAVMLATESFNRTEAKNKAIVLLSDGENFEDDALAASKIAKENNIVIHTVYFGTEQGGPIPLKSNSKIVGFKRDKNNETVITKPDIALMQKLASSNNGISVDGVATESIDLIVSQLDKLEKEAGESLQFSDYDSLFHLFAFPALLLLIIDFLISDRKMRWQYRLRSFMNLSLNKSKKH